MMRVTPAPLTPANQNPWYVLMTLFGEEEESPLDFEWHVRNRDVWNAWACQGLSDAEKLQLSELGFQVPDEALWQNEGEAIKKRHRAEMQRLNGEGFFYPGFPEPNAKIEMTRIAFDRDLFAGAFLFRAASIKFSETRFKKATFANAVFLGTTSFERAVFEGKAEFNEARFGSDATFGRAEFKEEAWVTKAVFRQSVDFHHATFGQTADFEKATFDHLAQFDQAVFGGLATFEGAAFRAGEIRFKGGYFKMPAVFEKATFASYPDLSGVIFHERTSFTAEEKFWPKRVVVSDQIGVAKASCAVIRQSLGKQGLPEAEHFFYRREMGFAGRSGAWMQRPPYWLFWLFSDYGYSILLPLVWVFLLIFGGGMVLDCGLPGSWPRIGFVESQGLSFANVFNFLGFHKTFGTEGTMQGLSDGMRVFSGFQTVAGVILVFFLGLGLRTRFRLR